ncbi:HAD-IIB family hydrolase [Hydrogenophaga sp. T2]|uniref:HAD-IIB family hydrolase n=1 Tax=Hydrogenophaga sp. T2 TaxID=3132823 RepID=UPI003CF9F76B
MQPTPLAHWPLAERARIHGVLTDIDDTLTADGALAPEAEAALQRLRAAGLPVFAVTGRPAGWSEPFALAWPIDAIVAENGAVALWNDKGRLHKTYAQDAATRRQNAERLQAAAARVLAELPHARLATDSAGRETDIAIDHSEHAHLGEADIARVVAILRGLGLTATVSSIHINAWIGSHDKLSGARWIVRERLGRALDDEIAHWVYVGDSTNDAVMFARFPHSVGVANVARFWPQLSHHPRHVAPRERGAGFADVVDAVLAARATP